MAREIPIRDGTIRLGQLLKLAGAIDSGAEARLLLAASPVLVNGEPETRRGRQLALGDVIQIGEEELLLVAAEPGV